MGEVIDLAEARRRKDAAETESSVQEKFPEELFGQTEPDQLPAEFPVSASTLEQANTLLTQSEDQQKIYARIGKWFRNKLFKWGKSEELEDENAYIPNQRRESAPYASEIQVRSYPHDDFFSYSAISKAMEENAPQIQMLRTKEYAYALVKTEKMNLDASERDTDQISAIMRITREGRPKAIKSEFGKTMPSQNASAEDRMRDAERAGFGVYKIKLVDGKVPSDGAVFEKIQSPPTQQNKLASAA